MFTRTPDVVIVGCGPLARETAKDLARRHRVLGAFSLPDEHLRQELSIPYLGDIAALPAFLQATPVDEVYMATTVAPHFAVLQGAIATCERLGTPFAVPAQTFRLERALPRDARAVPDGYLHYQCTPTQHTATRVKRMADIVLSAAALLALSPLFAVVAAIIKLTSPGPIFFKQVRVGLRGKTFEMFKFRSMVVDAEQRLAALREKNEQTGPTFKMARDPRVTAIGRFIRKYSIDELPQLLNVLRGEMSIVGPRPPVPPEVAQYQPWQRRRLSVVPGLTCFWQVMGRNKIGFDEWMLLDLQYVDQWSIGKDVSLIGRTVPVVVTGRGAS